MVTASKYKLSIGGEDIPDGKADNISEDPSKRSPHKGAFAKQVETLKSPDRGTRLRTVSGAEGELILKASDCGEDIVIMKNVDTGKRMVRSAASVIFNPSPSFGGDFFPDEEANIRLSIEGDDSDDLFPSASMTSLESVKHDERPPQPEAFLDWKRRRGHLFGLKFEKKVVKKELQEKLITPRRREEYQVVTNVSQKRKIKTSTSITFEEAPISRRSGSISIMKSKKKVTGNRFMLKDGSLIQSKKRVLRSGSSMSNLCGVVKHNPFLQNDGKAPSSKKRRSTRRRKKKKSRKTRDETLPGITEFPETSTEEDEEKIFEEDEQQEEESVEQPDIFKNMDPDLAAAITAAYEKATRLQEEGKVAEAIDAHMKAGQLLNNALFQLR